MSRPVQLFEGSDSVLSVSLWFKNHHLHSYNLERKARMSSACCVVEPLWSA